MSLTGAYESSNIFAKIIRGEMPAVKVYEDEEVICFMDIFPQSQGHCLVIPKNVEARNLLDFPAERIGPLFQRVQKIAAATVKALKPEIPYVLRINNGNAVIMPNN